MILTSGAAAWKNDCNCETLKNIVQKADFAGFDDGRGVRRQKPKILLHSCCGPCSTSVVERLSGSFDVTIFFYNPNITERDEYERRKQAQLEFIEQYNGRIRSRDRISFLEAAYEPERFFEVAKGLEDEPEGGKRCEKCFLLRLEKTAEAASMSGFDTFSTTLSVSPHKDYRLLSALGLKLGMRYSLTFLAEDFKKQNGFQRSIELSKAYGLYRQNYCGCCFSKR